MAQNVEAGIIWSNQDPNSWEPSPSWDPIAELPGRIIALQSSQLTRSVWALVELRRRWWQPWLPETREKWVNVILPERDSDGTRRAETA